MDVSCEFSRLLAEKFAIALDGQGTEFETHARKDWFDDRNRNIERSILTMCRNTFVPAADGVVLTTFEWAQLRGNARQPTHVFA